MKRTVFIFGVLLMPILMTIPAYSVDHQLGGDLRFRALTAGDWSGNDADSSSDRSKVDSRAHVNYTAKVNDDLTVYTSFRIDSVWGDAGTGRAGVSAATVKLKYSYLDFNVGETNFTVGMQDFFEARGILVYDVAPGVSVTTPLSDQFKFNAKWIKFGEGGINGGDKAHQDLDTIAIMPQIKLNDNITFKPYLWYVMSNEVKNADRTWNWWWKDTSKIEDLDMYYLGFDFDASMGATSVWFTALYQAGSANVDATWPNGHGSVDFSGIAALGGGSLNLGKVTLSGQLFYASGDDDPNDDKIEQFFSAEAGYYYWSEIMGLGSNDDEIPHNIAWSLTNIVGGGGTASVSVSDRMTVDFGLWYAAAVEDFQGSNGLVEAADYGTELNASMSYSLMDNLSLSFIGAYVIAGDALTEENVDGANIEGADPYFLQAQIKAKF